MTWLRDDNTSTSIDLAYKRGAIAAANKAKVGENPYDENSNRHWSWMNGFADTLTKLTKQG